MFILALSGSPTGGSSTDILLDSILEGASEKHIKTRLVKLNDKNIYPCQACGQSPEPDYCFFHDDMDELYSLMKKADAIILGSPIYFDSVSAQTKLFIDRTNCLRPLDFSDKSGNKFKKPLFHDKKGGIVIVGGENGKFETALRTARAFFIWAGIERVFELKYVTFGIESGFAKQDNKISKEAQKYGQELVKALSN